MDVRIEALQEREGLDGLAAWPERADPGRERSLFVRAASRSRDVRREHGRVFGRVRKRVVHRVVRKQEVEGRLVNICRPVFEFDVSSKN